MTILITIVPYFSRYASSQFHQHFKSSFSDIFHAPKKQTSSIKKLHALLSYEKVAHKMLVKLIPGLNLIILLDAY
jgi:hypothetical protein